MSRISHRTTEDREYGEAVIRADGFFLPTLRTRRHTAVGLQQSYFEALRQMYEPEVSAAEGVRIADAHHKLAAALTPAWVRAASLRGFIEAEPKPEAAADVLPGDEVHFKLSDAGHKRLAEIEGGWPLVPLATAAQAQSWMLRKASTLLLALAAGTAIGVTAALENLRQSPLAWVVLAFILVLGGVPLWRRWQLVQRTRRKYYDYWLYLGDRKHFERSEQDIRSEFKLIRADVATSRKQMETSRQLTAYRVRQAEERLEARLQEIEAWKEARLREIEQEDNGGTTRERSR